MCDSSTAEDLVNSCRPRFYWFSLFSSEMKWLSISVSQQLRTSPSPPLTQQQSPHNKFGLTKKTKEHFVKFINSIDLAKAANQIYNRRKQILKAGHRIDSDVITAVVISLVCVFETWVETSLTIFKIARGLSHLIMSWSQEKIYC